MQQEIKELNEKKLAGQYKISGIPEEDAIDPMLGEPK